MSSVFYIASDFLLTGRPNPHDRMISVNEALELGYEDIPDYMLEEGFDRDEPGALLLSDRTVNIDIDNDTIEDGDFDDDFSVWLADKVYGMQTEKEYCAFFECIRLTNGRVQQFIDYLKEPCVDYCYRVYK